jgi:hypothetical protein
MMINYLFFYGKKMVNYILLLVLQKKNKKNTTTCQMHFFIQMSMRWIKISKLDQNNFILDVFVVVESK